MKAVIYARYSSDNQREESIDGQLRECMEFAKYNGEYNHSGVLIEDGVPAIIDKDRFERVQGELKKNSKAPARHTADDDYLLTTKLFCGKCGAMMVAQAGTSHTGKVHRYYACVRQKKHKCDKKMLNKEKLENFIVYKTMGILKNDSVIEELSALLYNLQFNESTIIPQLEQQLRAKETEIQNVLDAIRMGSASKALVLCLNDLEKQRDELGDAIIKEQIQSPTYTQDEYRMALTNYRKIDITQQDGKRKIIDTFINAIYVFDDHLKIVYNGNNKEETVSLEAVENSSTLFSSGAPSQYNPNQIFQIGEGFGLFVYFQRYEQTYFPNGVPIRPESKPRGPRKKKTI